MLNPSVGNIDWESPVIQIKSLHDCYNFEKGMWGIPCTEFAYAFKEASSLSLYYKPLRVMATIYQV